jgi:putative transposase
MFIISFEVEEIMARPLDGITLLAYIRRLKLSKETYELLTHIRSSPPSRTPGARRGNMPVWYPSKKMQCIIKAESTKVEFPFLLTAEHDDDVLEVWDQPPSIPLEYLDKHGHLQRPMHTADYFVFRYRECGWVECKPAQELLKQAESRPNRYKLDEQGVWRCPPGEAFAARYGLTYQVWSSDQINWAVQDNSLFLEDYYQDLERLTIPETTLEILHQIVEDHPGITLADLHEASPDVPADLINVAIAKQTLYVDLSRYRLSEPWHTPVFRTRALARASTQVGMQETDASPVLLPAEAASRITPEGRELLERASDVDLATALFRNRVIHPEFYDDDEQTQTMNARSAVPARTRQRWQEQYRDAETQYGSGFLGLLPRYHNCGGQRKISSEVIALIHRVLETHYDTVTRKPKRGAYGEYLKCSEEQHLKTVDQKTFYLEARRHKAAYDQTVVREGTRAAYPFKDYVRSQEQTVNRHGSYAWAMAHLDHTELNLVLCDSRTGQPLGKCWLTLLILSHPRRIAAYALTFDPPSYRSCLMVLRLCVKRYGRLPTAITVDGGPEFASVYFEQLLALYRVRKHQRPAAEPRFGAPQERLFGSMQTEFLYHLLGNTQATQQPRQMTKATDPRRHAVWTLPRLAERVQQWADEEYETIRHPALGMTPREAYDLSMKRDGERSHKSIDYDDTFLKATFPTTRKGTAKVEPGVGARMNYLDYWCEAMRDPTVEGTQIKVRFDPFDVSVGYAYIDGRWRKCDCPYTEFAGCSERELQLLTEELRKRNRLQYGRENIEVTQKQLATFRRENMDVETILRQQRHDRETRAALVVLEGGKRPPTRLFPVEEEKRELEQGALEKEKKANPYNNLLVLRRIEL